MSEKKFRLLATMPALAFLLTATSAAAQAVVPPPPVPPPAADEEEDEEEEEPGVAPPPSATPPSATTSPTVVPRPVVAPPETTATPGSSEVSGPPSDLPYYVPQGAERLREVKAPETPPQPEAPGLQIGFAPLFRYHFATSLVNLPYAEIGGVVRLGDAGFGISVSGTTWGSVAGAFELPTLTGIPIYKGPVTVAFVPRGYVQLEVHPGLDPSMGYNAGFIPSFQVAGCQGIPWYFNAGAHLTGHIQLLLDGGGEEPRLFGTVGPAVEMGILIF